MQGRHWSPRKVNAHLPACLCSCAPLVIDHLKANLNFTAIITVKCKAIHHLPSIQVSHHHCGYQRLSAYSVLLLSSSPPCCLYKVSLYQEHSLWLESKGAKTTEKFKTINDQYFDRMCFWICNPPNKKMRAHLKEWCFTQLYGSVLCQA